MPVLKGVKIVHAFVKSLIMGCDPEETRMIVDGDGYSYSLEIKTYYGYSAVFSLKYAWIRRSGVVNNFSLEEDEFAALVELIDEYGIQKVARDDFPEEPEVDILESFVLTDRVLDSFALFMAEYGN